MLIIPVEDKGGIEKALKKLKSKVIKTKQLKALRERKEFEKNTSKRRKKMANAKYVQRKKDEGTF